MSKGRKKVAVIGAGFVGAASAFAMAIRQTCNELVLIDIAEDKAIGEARDILQGLPFLGNMNIYPGDFSCVSDCDVIVMAAGAGRKPGESRLDLAKKNVGIAKSVIDEVMKYYNGGVILTVANPVDILTYMIAKWTNLPSGMVLGTGTTLDTVRFRSALAKLVGIDVINIHGYIIGEHGDSQLAAWSNTHIAGIQVDAYCATNGILLNDEVKEQIMHQVKTDGAEIIKRKGVTCYGVAVCVATLVHSLLRDSETIRTVSVVLNGEFGVSDVAISLPAVIGSRGVSKVIEPILTPSELEFFIKSGETCKAVLEQCKEL